MCYEVTLINNQENKNSLRELGFRWVDELSQSSPFIGVQLDARGVIDRYQTGWENPLIRIKYLPSILVLPTPRARLQFLFDEFLIDEHVYKKATHIINISEAFSKISNNVGKL